MSRGRRKKNSAPFSGSASTSSRLSRRWRYPASRSISVAASESDPLFGTATRSMVGPSGWVQGMTGTAPGCRAPLQMRVDVLGRQPARDHHHLDVVEQLRDLLRGTLRRL